MDVPPFKQRLFILEPGDPDSVIELKESCAQLNWYKLVPNQIIVLKVIENEDYFDDFIEESNYETGFKGTVFNK